MKDKILDILRRQKGFVSGETLSRQLGVSRSMIWKVVKALQQEGYPIEAITRRGYRLTGEPDILSETEMKRMLDESGLKAVFPAAFFQTQTDSTNLMARRAAENGAPNGSIFLAEEQTGGKGRRGRSWNSSKSQDLTFSLLFRPDAEPAGLAPVTLFAGLCTAAALNRLAGGGSAPAQRERPDYGIKWPNDIIAAASGRKLGGLLTELIVEENRVRALIIGMGININTTEFPADISRTATSLLLEQNKTYRRLDILRLILSEIAGRLPQIYNPESWLPEYRPLCLTLGREVRVIAQNGDFTGKALDVDDEGELLVEMQNGGRQTVRSGEVSVRGLFGYL